MSSQVKNYKHKIVKHFYSHHQTKTIRMIKLTVSLFQLQSNSDLIILKSPTHQPGWSLTSTSLSKTQRKRKKREEPRTNVALIIFRFLACHISRRINPNPEIGNALFSFPKRLIDYLAWCSCLGWKLVGTPLTILRG